MDVEKQVASYYTGGRLEEKILGTLRSAGKDLTQLRTDDFVAIDDLHVGGREAVQELAGFMGLRPDMHRWTWAAELEDRRATLPSTVAKSQELI